MTEKELVAKYNTSTRTVRRWKQLNAPFDDEAAMSEFIKSQRIRLGVSKLARRSELASKTPTTAPAREVAVEMIPAPPAPAKDALDAITNVPAPQDAVAPETLDEAPVRSLELLLSRWSVVRALVEAGRQDGGEAA